MFLTVINMKMKTITISLSIYSENS